MLGTRGVKKTRTSFLDLSGADLGGVHVGHANLGAANLSGAKTNYTTLKRAGITNLVLHVLFMQQNQRV